MNIPQQDVKNKNSDGSVRKVAVALSGGVDSAVAAALLQRQGYHVEGFYMKNWSDEASANYRGQHQRCPWEDDIKDVTAICETLDIPWQSINFEKEYRAKVFQYFLDETKAGRTPNPDVLCNTQIKFLTFLERMRALGFEHIATGHYARTDGRTLRKGVDQHKDQSYFIHHVTHEQLGHILFPVGDLRKTEVRQLAEQFGLPVAYKPDSQGLCFVGDIDFQSFIRHYVKAEPGPMVLTDGTVMGQHHGLAYYTIGQRYGIEIGGTGPYYVVDKRMGDNTLVICRGADHPSLFSQWCTFTDEHWVSGQRPGETFSCTVKIRYRSPDVACVVHGQRIEFAQPARAVTPGQFVVFYDHEKVLGGAVIDDKSFSNKCTSHSSKNYFPEEN